MTDGIAFAGQPIGSYDPDGPLVLFGDGGDRKQLGFGRDGEWLAMVDGDRYPLGFESTE